MAANLEKLAGEWGKYPRIADGLISLANFARQSGAPETFSVATPEEQLEIKRFSAEQKEALGKQGFVIYALTRQSIKTLRDSGHKFWSSPYSRIFLKFKVTFIG